MENKIEARKKFIYEKVGEEAINLLKESGLDIDIAVTNILIEQEKKKENLESMVAIPTINNTITSELVYLSNDLGDNFGKEYFRRLKLIGLSDNNTESLYTQEKLILAGNNMGSQREQPWVQRYFIMPDSTSETLPKIGNMTLSELILITDDANSAFFRDHEVLPDKAWNALCIAACCAQYTEGRYAQAFMDRTGKLGWSKEQSGAYTRNECLLTERLKWDMHENPAWTEETTDLSKFKRG